MAANPSIQLGTDGNWAIKEDNLLAYKKDGTRFFNKEFDFSRGSSATYVAKDGLIKVSGVTDTELVVNGDFATDSDWSKAGSVEILNGLASFTITSGSFAKISQNISLTNNKIYKLTLQVLGDNSGSNIYVRDTATGDNGGLQKTIILVEGTTDYTFYFTANANSNAIYIKRNTSSGNYQFSIDNISVKEIQTDVPRIDFTDDATGHLLLEPQSTNLVTYSEDFSEWNKSDATITSSSFNAPDGTQNASTLTTSASGGTVQDNLTVSNGNVTFSVFVKKGTTDGVRLRIDAATDSNGYFDLVNNTVYSSTDDADIENYGNGWYRVSISTNVTSFVKASIYTTDGTTSYDNGTLNIWGAQLEQLPYPTSYIPTFGSTATRNGEVCNNSGSVQDFNSEEGVLYAEIAALADRPTNRAISISDGTLDNRVVLRINSDDLYSYVQSNGTYSMFKSTAISEIKNYNKCAVKYKENDFELWVNGSRVATDNTGNSPIGLNILEFEEANGSNDFYGKTKDLKVFKRVLSDGELYLLTVPQYQSYQEMATALNYTL